MKRLLLFLLSIFVCINSMAQKTYAEQFKNEKLGVWHVEDKKGSRVWPCRHYLLFENFTNNNMRVKYKVKGRVLDCHTSESVDFSYTATKFLKPKDCKTDNFIDPDYTEDICTFLFEHCKDGHCSVSYDCQLLFFDFELINYGVEKKNYETEY